ncbi:pentatricopeptide repeat-containing protein At3g53700, chloroplastic-like [Magnolia sinica]|uniref:pentatricopeptide repeat-containing protein At3g53700, chloroplastic-like n=1 Tax=Magnolia sinica TaxID=86752 RepID=UPI002659C8B7|nr:pentatricopeptide repeat-containing protein At3g53700, chloroplastic-like [Magnolia sinica]
MRENMSDLTGCVSRHQKMGLLTSQFVENCREMIVVAQKWLSSNFEMKDMSKASFVLGIKIQRDRSKRLLGLSQETYIKKVLERFRMQGCKSIDTLVEKSHGRSLNLYCKMDTERVDITRIPYASAVVNLMDTVMQIGVAIWTSTNLLLDMCSYSVAGPFLGVVKSSPTSRSSNMFYGKLLQENTVVTRLIPTSIHVSDARGKKIISYPGRLYDLKIDHSMCNMCESEAEEMGILRTDFFNVDEFIGGFGDSAVSKVSAIGDVDLAFDMLKKMEVMSGNHVKPNCITYSYLINGFRKAGKVAVAEEFWEDMQKVGIEPNVWTCDYDQWVRDCCKNGPMKDSLKYFNMIIEDKDLVKDVVPYNILINYLYKNRNIEGGKQLLSSMFTRGLIPDLVTYSTLIDGYCKEGESSVGTTRVVLDEMRSSLLVDVITFNTLLNGYFSIQKIGQKSYEGDVG